MRKKDKSKEVPKVPQFNDLTDDNGEKKENFQQQTKTLDQVQELHKFLHMIRQEDKTEEPEIQKQQQPQSTVKPKAKVPIKPMPTISSNMEDKINSLYKQMKKPTATTTTPISTNINPPIPAQTINQTNQINQSSTAMDEEPQQQQQQQQQQPKFVQKVITAKKQEIPLQYLKAEDNEEYDPMQPNDYEEIKVRREKQQQAQRDIESSPMSSKYTHPIQENIKPQTHQNTNNAGINISTDNRTAPIDFKADNFSFNDQEIVEEDNSKGKKSISMDEKILNMMMKQGYKLGKGLGKKEQGIVTPVIAEKINDNAARITQSSALMGNFLDQNLVIRKHIEEQKLNSSHVLLLRNMVGKNQVDDLLRQEVKEECSHYGKVKNVVIYIMPTIQTDEQVRIFVEFEEEIEAMRSYMDLHGRYFAGRIVKAGFYDYASYKANQFHLPLI